MGAIDEVIRRAGVDNKSREAPRRGGAGLDEHWSEVLEPLKPFDRFSTHPTARCLRREFSEAEKTRKRLIVAACLLFVQQEAEAFHAALDTMDRMEQLDPPDAFGFRMGALFGDLQWAPLRARLESQQKSWEKYMTWNADIEMSALPKWRGEDALDAQRWLDSPSQLK